MLVGGSADLAESNLTDIADGGDLTATEAGRNLRYGVREHGMGAISNGLAVHGGLRPFCATFLVFSDYMRPSVRLAALMGLPVVYVWTHDSIGLGGDGPTHQPIEHLASLRLMPNLHVIRPADGPETAEAWRAALRTDRRPDRAGAVPPGAAGYRPEPLRRRRGAAPRRLCVGRGIRRRAGADPAGHRRRRCGSPWPPGRS